MSRSNFWRLAAIILVVGWSVYNLIPVRDRDFDTYIASKVSADKAGFDVLMDEAHVEVKAGRYPSTFVALKEIARKKNINLAQFFPQLNLADVRNLNQRNEILLNYWLQQSQGKLKLGLDLKGGVAFTLEVDDRAMASDEFSREKQLDKAVEILTTRVNGLGVAEPIIRVSGNNKIEIQLAGVSATNNPDVLASLQKPAKLTFHRVNRDIFPATNKAPAPGYVLMEREETDPRSGTVYKDAMYVKQIPDLSGSLLKQATVGLTPIGAYQINLEFTDEGAKRFEEITQQIATANDSSKYRSLPEGSPGRYGRLAIVLDGHLYSAPRVMQAISGGHAQITGQFTQREALDLANVLNNPLEFELKVGEIYEIGPSLAEDARISSIRSAFLGAGLVVLFMVAYYFLPGVIAVFSVFINILITIGVLASLGATLTLPGIAALVLTIGMAVDSNILILERVREEIKAGKSNWLALQAGYNRAFGTIFDANLTSIIASVILIFLGTGPVKGFGVTLTVGIAATLFCALIVNRFILEVMVEKQWLNRLVGLNLFKESKINFMRLRLPALVISVVLLVAGATIIALKGKDIYGIDFLGGEELTLSFNEKPSSNEIYAIDAKEHLGHLSLYYQTMLGEDKEFLKIQTEVGKGQKVFDALQQAFPQAQFELIGLNQIGSAVSQDLQYKAIMAILASLLCMLLYIAFRFEIGYGIGAMVSLALDAFLSLGFFVMLGGQFTVPMVAAILMIIGFSINDKIVVFDRIREELNLNPTLQLADVINLAINRTLSRTILTSLTAFLSTLALYIFGVGEIHDFALMFMIGIVTGTLSSIFLASPIFFWWHKGNRRSAQEKQETAKYAWDSSVRGTR